MSGFLGLAGGCASYSTIRTKADAMKYAIDTTMKYSCDGSTINYNEALELYKFFCEHVQLLDTDVVPLNELVSTTLDKIKDMLPKKDKDKLECI
jgi:hypothetical protein